MNISGIAVVIAVLVFSPFARSQARESTPEDQATPVDSTNNAPLTVSSGQPRIP